MADNPEPGLLRQLLDYDAESGVLTWKKRANRRLASWNGQYAGKRAGTLRTDGYIAVKIANVAYPAHRLIWAMMHDEWPECVRHRNRNDADNRLVNLVAATWNEIRRTRAEAKMLQPT